MAIPHLKAYENIKAFIIYIYTVEFLISLHLFSVVSDTEVYKCKYLHFDFKLICSCCKKKIFKIILKEKKKKKLGISQVSMLKIRAYIPSTGKIWDVPFTCDWQVSI